ncbi:uncharacterized protein LOC119599952 [Lucilia sericata]|uniref:uncharacterized protein LOC119599952 n=1 Tax=Lucilia sericata TaxID=13632 RepID=UPI0018A8791C|nr:uncharacterized protein LOC119599952 [Lucilia sericata]
MGKIQFCRICRTEKNLKYKTKELRQLNKKQLLLANATQQGQGNNRASKKLLLTTPTLGNICHVCDERIQIFHRLDDGGHDSCSDVEIEVVENTNKALPMQFVDAIPNGGFVQRTQRPDTPVIVDDDDMLFNIFMQKFNQKTQIQRHQMAELQQADGPFVNQFHAPYTPPQSSAGGSEGDESKVIEVLTSRENTPAPIAQALPPPPLTNSNLIDSQGHRIVAIIELDDVDENDPKNNDEIHSGLLTPAASSSNELSFTESIEHRSGTLSPIKNANFKSPSKNEGRQSTAAAEEDDDEIVFRKVDIEQDKSPAMKKRKRKSYDEKELRLVASLSLVSSDSEAEDSPMKVQIKKSFNPPAIAETPPFVSQDTHICKVCKIKFPDSESLSVHERIHQGVKCTLCQVGFQQVKRLIHHMRRKHREYNGDTLSEKPRSGQDSCMTIRLRYMQRTTFYECQLCGRIDEIFREHKEHIIEKHANESKTLKDPIMKQLKCPLCKAKCGAQYLSLCRHLISSHEYQQYKSHLRELVHVSAFGWNAARQQEVAKTAKIFQFTKRKTFFFECKICRKVVAGYLHHLRHVNKHQASSNEQTKVKAVTPNEIPPSSSTTLVTKSSLDIGETQNKDKLSVSKKQNQLDNKSKKLGNKSKLNKKSIQIEKVHEKSKKILKSNESTEQKLKLKISQKEKLNKPLKIDKSKKTALMTKINKTETVTNESRKKIQIKIKLKPKDKETKEIPSGEKLNKRKAKKDSSKIKTKDNEKLRGKSKVKAKDLDQKPQVKKVKVKPPIRQIDLQKYKCSYCLKKFKGFRLYNLHLLQQHKENEYTECNTCNKLYTNSSLTTDHIKQCPQTFPASKQKRKFSDNKPSLSDNLIDNGCQLNANKVPKKCDESLINLEDNNLWLKDLLKIKESSRISDSNSTYNESTDTALYIPKQSNLQCCYCLHLLPNGKALEEHTKQQHSHKSDILIKYKPFKNISK